MRNKIVALLGCAAACSGIGAAAARPHVLSHFYYVDDDAAWSALERNSGVAGLLSPVWFHTRANGEVRVAVDARVEELARKRSIALLPVVMNEDFDPLAARAAWRDEASMRALSSKLVALSQAGGYRGLQLDFENLEARDREGMVRWTAHLSAALRAAGMELSVAVPAPVFSTGSVDARPKEWLVTDRSAGFDYARLAEASSFLTLMTYDQYATADAPGPIAGIEWMEACIRKTLEWAPADKITLGLPLYHRRWAGSAVSTGTVGQARELIAAAKSEALIHPIHAEPVARYVDGSTPNIIWFQTAESLDARMRLVDKYKLRGFSAWRIGQEDPAVWTRTFRSGS